MGTCSDRGDAECGERALVRRQLWSLEDEAGLWGFGTVVGQPNCKAADDGTPVVTEHALQGLAEGEILPVEFGDVREEVDDVGVLCAAVDQHPFHAFRSVLPTGDSLGESGDEIQVVVQAPEELRPPLGIGEELPVPRASLGEDERGHKGVFMTGVIHDGVATAWCMAQLHTG